MIARFWTLLNLFVQLIRLWQSLSTSSLNRHFIGQFSNIIKTIEICTKNYVVFFIFFCFSQSAVLVWDPSGYNASLHSWSTLNNDDDEVGGGGCDDDCEDQDDHHHRPIWECPLQVQPARLAVLWAVFLEETDGSGRQPLPTSSTYLPHLANQSMVFTKIN